MARTTKHGSPEERIQRVLLAAERCFSRRGYYETTYADIIRESGLSRGSLYWHFDSKEQLYEAVFDASLKYLQLLADTDPRTLPERPSLLEQLLQSTADDLIENEPRYRLLFLSPHPASTAPKIRRGAEIFSRYIENMVGESLRRGEIGGGDARRLPELLRVLIDGMILRSLLDRDFDPKGFARRAKHFLPILGS